MATQEDELSVLAALLAKNIADIFKEKGVRLSQVPTLERKNILEYKGRMRADGMEKFNSPTFVAAVNYFVSSRDMQKNNALGTVIVYIEQNYVPTIMKLLKYPSINEENDDALCDSAGTLANIIAGRFKSAVSANGYIELEMSPFMSYRNTAPNGVAFCFKEYDKYQIGVFIFDKKRLVVELTMGHIPKTKS